MTSVSTADDGVSDVVSCVLFVRPYRVPKTVALRLLNVRARDAPRRVRALSGTT